MPTLIRWPGVIKPGTIVNEICAHEDFIPTLAAAAGNTDLVSKLKAGSSLGGKRFKVHLDGYNLLPFLKGAQKQSPRQEVFYWSDDGDLMALRVGNWKATFMMQHHAGLDIWLEGFDKLRGTKIGNLRSDPYERGFDSSWYADWMAHRAFLLVPAQAVVGKFVESFKDFPPRAKAASFTVSDVMEKIAVGSAK